MKKTIIALATATALAAPMAAQAGAKIYGALQVEIASVDNDGYGENNTGGSRTGTAATQSALKVGDNKRGRIGIKVSEDLGGGLKGLAKFEWQVDTPNGNISDGAREGWVGLKGGFGEVKAGRIKTAYKYTGGVKYDPFVTTYMEARKSGGMKGGAFGQNSFWNTSASYKNKFGPVSVWVTYGADEGDGTTANPGNSGDVSWAVKYKASSFEVFAAANSDDSATGKTANDVTKFGGQYKIGGHKISLQLEDVDDTANTEIIFLGYQMKMGKNTLVAQIGQTDATGTASDVDYLALGLIHGFSKTTRAYLGYRESDGTGTNDLSAISAGLRVSF